MKVAVVILNFNVRELTLKCIESVKESTFKDFNVIVVDNSPEEDLQKFLDQDVEYVPSENTGYTGGNNLGIKKALKSNPDYIFILNPDTTIDNNCIKALVETAEKENADILGPKIYFNDNKTIWHAGGKMDKLNVLGSNIGVDEKDTGQYDQISEVDFITGAALFVKTQVFEKIGLFDEKYFLYYEDADFCERARIAGFKILFQPKAVVCHENAKSTGLGSSLQDYFITRNRFVFASKFLPFRTRFALFREALRNLGNPSRRLALWDFLIGNFGKGSFKV